MCSLRSGLTRSSRPLRFWLGVLLSTVAAGAASQTVATPAQPVAPAWAYPTLPSTAPPAVRDDGVQHQLAGSTHAFTRAQLFDLFTAHDWFPESHPPMPAVVARGRPPEVRACGMCHYPNGQGRPENAALAGLPAAYIVQQMQDYKAGLRRSAAAQAGPHLRMVATAMHVSDEEVRAAAEYFAAQPYRPWITVVETDQVPLTQVVTGSMWAAVPGKAREPIGQRIVEVPNDLDLTELRDPRSGFTAYVPRGSLERGRQIATQGEGAVMACSSCHGPGLKGMGLIPPLAGRSAQYLYRQLNDMRQGVRAGPGAVAMRGFIGQLSPQDMIAVVAYAASLRP